MTGGLLVFVQSCEGVQRPVEVNSEATVRELLAGYGKVSGSNDGRLTFEGEELCLDAKLVDCSVRPESVLEFHPCSPTKVNSSCMVEGAAALKQDMPKSAPGAPQGGHSSSAEGRDKLEGWFDSIVKQGYKLRLAEQEAAKTGESLAITPLGWWRDLKPKIDEEFGTEPLEGVRWQEPVYSKTVLDDDFFDDGTVNQHFLNQTVRIPREVEVPTARKVLQLALNVGQGQAHGNITEDWKLSHFIASVP